MLITSYNPQFALWFNQWVQGDFECDINRFSRLINNKLRRPPRRLLCNPSSEQLQDLARNSDALAVDIETGAETGSGESYTGLNPTRARLKCIGLGNEEEGMSVWWEGASLSVQKTIREILLSSKITKIFHNGHWFDLRVMARYGLLVNTVADTRDMRRALSTTSPLSLRYLASLYDDVEPWKENEEDDEKGIVFTEVKEDLMRYNAMDCVVTARAHGAMKREEDWGSDRVQRLYNIHSELSRIAGQMHTTGIHVHKQNREYMIWCIDQEIDQLRDEFLALVNIDGMRCNSNDMRSLIFKRHENERVHCYSLPDPYSEKMYTDETLSTIKVDESSLLNLITSGECPDSLIKIIDAYWVCQRAKHRKSFLTSKVIDQVIGLDGRLRPGWNSCGTDTMRFSCSGPNAMNIPQLLRAWLGPAPGRVMVHADKSQLEIRVMEVIADDPALLDRINSGDVYGQDAKDWFNLPKEMNVKKAKPKARQACKIIHLASQYAAGVATIHSQALESDRAFKFETTRLLNNGFKRTYCATVAYWEAEQKRVLNCGYSEGRLLQGRRYYPKPPLITEIANWPVQRTASEMMCLEMIELDEKLRKYTKDARIQVILHDAFDVDASEEEEGLVKEIMNEVMDRKYTIDGRERHFPVEMKVARFNESLDNGFGSLDFPGSWAQL